MWEKKPKCSTKKIQWKRKQSVMLEETLRVILASRWLRCWWQSDVNKHTTGNMEVCKNDRGCAHRSAFPMDVKDKEEWCEWWPDYDIDLARNNPRCVLFGVGVQQHKGSLDTLKSSHTCSPWPHQKYLMLPPWMRHLILNFMNTSAYIIVLLQHIFVFLAGRNTFWWGIFFFPDVILGYSFD